MTRLPDIKRLGDTISRSGVYGYTADQMREHAALVRADEREACAAQLDFNAQAASNGGDEYIAALLWQEAEELRARGKTK